MYHLSYSGPKLHQHVTVFWVKKSICFVSFCSGPSFPIVEKSVKVSESGEIYFGISGKKL